MIAKQIDKTAVLRLDPSPSPAKPTGLTPRWQEKPPAAHTAPQVALFPKYAESPGPPESRAPG